MSKINYKILLPIVGFILIVVTYFSPVLQGKVISQNDIKQYVGMSAEQTDYRLRTGEESYWTNGAFGGMPTYQLGAKYPHNYIKKIDEAIRFLPRPADYVFLYFISFYILLLVLKVDYLLAAVGALCFGFSTYLIIILGVGHNAKAHAIGYFPLVFSGICLLFDNKKRFWGGLLIAFSMGLEISSNHYQMTYYLLILIFIFGLFKLWEAIKLRLTKDFFINAGVFIAATTLSLLMNATSLMTTKEYVDWSTRGHSELRFTPEGIPKTTTSGLDKDYITEYSYGIFESLNLFVPRLLGGSSAEALDRDSHTYNMLLRKGLNPDQVANFVERMPVYWGDQPIVAAPAYIGAVCIFLFVLALFVVKGRQKHFLVAGVIISLLLSWGKNIPILTNLMIDYFPMYNNFRSVSSIQVLLEMCVPVLAFIGLQKYLSNSIDNKQRVKSLVWTTAICGGVLAMLWIAQGAFNFSGGSDGLYRRYFDEEIMNTIRLDRRHLYVSDILRSALFVALTVLAFWAYHKEKLNAKRLAITLAVLVLFDLGGVAWHYVNNDAFVSKTVMKKPFELTEADKAILRDTSYYRVWEPSVGLNGGRTSFFHKTLGGYHAAKPLHLQNLFYYQIDKKNKEILNMLNVKYTIDGDIAHLNEDANGNTWFVSNLVSVATADKEMAALDTLDTKATAVIRQRTTDFPKHFTVDSTATLKLLHYAPNKLIYESTNANKGFAVFSEMYYPHGWTATIDGVNTSIYKVNYALRGIFLPKGKHQIAFIFAPAVVTLGSYMSLIGFLIFLSFVAWGCFRYFRMLKNTSHYAKTHE